MTDSHENYRKTVVLYCKDIADQFRDKSDFASEVGAIDQLVAQAMNTGADVSLMRDLAEVLDRAHGKAMTLYARYPQSGFLQGMIGRVDSVRRMCSDCAE